MNILGNRLKESRKKQNLTQDELAKKAYLSKNTISNIERGITRKVRLDEIKVLAYVLMVTEDYLAGRSDDSNKTKDGLNNEISFPPEWHWKIEIEKVLKKHSRNVVIEKVLRDCVYMLGQLDTEEINYTKKIKIKILQKTIDLLNEDEWKDAELLSDFLEILHKRETKIVNNKK